jgi:hypothetical protein
MKNVLISVSSFGIATLCVLGCSSESAGPDEQEVASASMPRPEGDPTLSSYSFPDPYNPSCTYFYSDVVPAYIDYASVHCDGWTGKVFCEYSSLASTYGPGWGTCQCYNKTCEDDSRMQGKHGRCYGRRCR